ncbi:MAG TPA: hypothetical protein VGM88_21830 [Kofleriaceae bacterium]
MDSTERQIAVAGAVVVAGWAFIAWANHFHVSPPVVIICLAWIAVVALVYNLWRTGAATVAEEGEAGDSTWARDPGLLGELEREKRTLLKAIKEAEFDFEMGKLSKEDVDEMVNGYRARAIEVIKELDRIESGKGDTRAQIEREVKARLAVAENSKAAKKEAAAKRKRQPQRAAAKGAKPAPRPAPVPDDDDDAETEAEVNAPPPEEQGLVDSTVAPSETSR